MLLFKSGQIIIDKSKRTLVSLCIYQIDYVESNLREKFHSYY